MWPNLGVERISENVYSIGVINPSLRVFDIIMKANYGTSYNSYFITAQKNVIIDTVHDDFFEEYINNLSTITDLNEIDYIVVNHAEPDHSGSLKKLLKMLPKAKVVCTLCAQKYLKQITNTDFEAINVKDGDTLDIGGQTLQFVASPMLHWPDSMMTLLKKEKILFSCDFLGAHFCEPNLLDTKLHYEKEYLLEFKNYYNGIFSPFKNFVRQGLKKIQALDLNAICPGHGPILTKTIKSRINDYYNWSTQSESSEKFIVVIYASAYGFTKKLAEAAFNAINEYSNENKNIKAKILDAVSTPIEQIAKEISNCSGLMIGSCTINRDAPKIIWDILSQIDAINARGKPAGVFGSFGWSGEAVEMIAGRLKGLGFRVKEGPIKANFLPSNNDIEKIQNYAKGIAAETKRT